MATNDDIELTIGRLRIVKNKLECAYDKLEAAYKEMREERDALRAMLKDCRNELCLRCGSYREKHLGACDGCRWKDVG